MDQNTQQLQNYIATQIQAGQSPDEISAQLIKAKWPVEQVHQAFLAVQSQVLPTNMQTNPEASKSESDENSGNAVVRAFGQRKGRIKTGWLLFKNSMKILNGNRYLFRYFIMTWIAVIAFNAGMIAFFWFVQTNLFESERNWYVLVFFSYLFVYVIINFYATALAGNILDIYKGNRQPYSTYVKAARKKLGPIFIYSVVAAIIGTIINLLIERLGRLGQVISWIIGTTWSISTLFALPLIIDTNTSGLGSIKKSASLIKDNWGEGLTAKVSVNTPSAIIQFMVATIFSLIFSTLFSSGNANIVAIIILYFTYIFIAISFIVLGSFANSIVNCALYYYAVNKQIPPGFSEDLLSRVMIKGKKRLFGKDKEKQLNV